MWNPTETFEEGKFKQTCGVCGATFPNDQFALGSDGVLRCKAFCKEMPVSERDRIEALARKGLREAPPPPHARKAAYSSNFGEEASLFEFLIEHSPQRLLAHANGLPGASGGETVLSAGWTGVYLYELIDQAGRPTIWITRATEKLTELADWLLTKQIDNGPAAWNTGAFTGTLVEYSHSAEETAMGGLALLYAYRVTGVSSYLTGARNAAGFLRVLQCGGETNTYYSTTTFFGTDRWHSGMWGHSCYTDLQYSSPVIMALEHKYYPSDLVGLAFLKELLTTDGEGTYGAGTADVPFDSASPASLATMMSEARAFWTTGVGGVTALAPTTIREYFDAFDHINFWHATGAWQYLVLTYVTSLNIAKALWALHKYEGYTSQVSALYLALRGFTSSATYEPADDVSPYDLATSTDGTFDANLALPVHIDIATSTNAGFVGASYYDWATVGLLAGIQTAVDQASFKTAKETLGTPRPRTPFEFRRDFQQDDLRLAGYSGLSLQTHASGVTLNTEQAAMVGLMYRQAPRATEPGV